MQDINLLFCTMSLKHSRERKRILIQKKEKNLETLLSWRIVMGSKEGGKMVWGALAFSARDMLVSLCSRTDPKAGDPYGRMFKYETSFTTCKPNVIHQIPVLCGKVCISQTGSCVNQWLKEHAYSLWISLSGDFAAYCDREGCKGSLSDTRILVRDRNRVERKIIEAFFILQKGEEMFVSSPPLSFSLHEYEYLSAPCQQ